MPRPESQVYWGLSSSLTTVDWSVYKELLITMFNNNKFEVKITARQPISRMVLTEKIFPEIIATDYKPLLNPNTGRSDFTVMQKQRKDIY